MVQAFRPAALFQKDSNTDVTVIAKLSILVVYGVQTAATGLIMVQNDFSI